MGDSELLQCLITYAAEEFPADPVARVTSRLMERDRNTPFPEGDPEGEAG